MIFEPRRFRLHRYVDVSGVSGTGMVATGAHWPDGTAALHWHGVWPTTTVLPGPNGMEAVAAIYGHGGSTVVEWIDPEPLPEPLPAGDPGAPPPGGDALGAAARSLDPLCPGVGTHPPEPSGPPPSGPTELGDVRGR